MMRADAFTALVNVIAFIATFLRILAAYTYLKRAGIERGEYYPLLLLPPPGHVHGCGERSGDRFVALELLSIPLYILSGCAVPMCAPKKAR